MYSRRLLVGLVTSAAVVMLLLALHHRRTVEDHSESGSLESRSRGGASDSSVSSSSSLASNANRLGRQSSYDPAKASAFNLAGSAGKSRPTNTAQAIAESRTGANSSPDSPTQPDPQSQRPRFWRTDSNDGYTLTTDYQIVHSGLASALLEASANQLGEESKTAAFQACSATDFQGKKAKFTIFLYGDDGFGSAEIWLRVDDPTQSELPINVVRQAATLPSPPDWAPISVTIPVSPGATILTYGVVLHGPGPLRIDTAQLDIVEADGAIKQEPARDPTAAEKQTGISTVLRYPRNMDFEEYFTAP